MMGTYFYLTLLVALLCIAQAVREFRRKDYVWAGLNCIAALILMSMPIQTHSVVVDLPSSK